MLTAQLPKVAYAPPSGPAIGCPTLEPPVAPDDKTGASSAQSCRSRLFAPWVLNRNGGAACPSALRHIYLDI